MAGFNYEKNLPHQENAIQTVLNVFENAKIQQNGSDENPSVMLDDYDFTQNVTYIQKRNQIDVPFDKSNVLDIMMETGTGKTYTYTKTMFELHKCLGVFKFVIVVPTLSIKAGTQNFLQSEDLKKHFQLDFAGDYDRSEIELYVVQSQKAKSKKHHIPTDIVRFINAENRQKIHILLINQGMINSDTMAGTDKGNDGSRLIKDSFNTPIEAIASVKPFLILDEPHKFKSNNKTWQNILKFKPQFIVRYGATFPILKNNQVDYRNLLYRLTAIDAFNQDLVKGVNVFMEEVQGDDGVRVKLADIVGSGKNLEAIFETKQESEKLSFCVSENDSLHKIHHNIDDLFIDKMNKSTVVLSNGVELKKGDSFNPYVYSQALSDKMMRLAIREHFKLERELLTRPNGRIKPLTLFFIDDIKGYREGNHLAGSLKVKFEQFLKAEIEQCLSIEQDDDYKQYLQKTLENLPLTHGGYFSQDNSDKDEKIEQEVFEILHDKQSLLSLENPRRFIFSKWTLREGWDNPNVFGICKLRSSGSETSKLQEVGRGLRLPVNEYGGRVKDTLFKLNYFVDNTEKDFVERLTTEINKSMPQETVYHKLSDELVEKIVEFYPDKDPFDIQVELIQKEIVNKKYDFIQQDSFDQIKQLYPKAFVTMDKLKAGKVDFANKKTKNKVSIRAGKYDELKALWEKINEKVILQYEIKTENEFLALFTAYLKQNSGKFVQSGIKTVKKGIKMYQHQAQMVVNDSVYEHNFEPIVEMSYGKFLQKLSQVTFIKISTLHNALYQLKDEIDINHFLNIQTINSIKAGFNRFLLFHSFSDFNIAFNQIDSKVHPTKFTNKQGQVLSEISSADLGLQNDEKISPLESYLFDRVFYDSEIEKENIVNNEIKEVMVFTKIPKNSIKIPVAGGGTYSPDFAYIIKKESGEVLNLVVESKGVESNDILRKEETKKIQHAEQLFKQFGNVLNIKFVSQFNQDKIVELIKCYLQDKIIL
ncbi:type III restriction-modification system endonuclease [Phocoenobacter atlanticus]|uniref:type III restriction-modification system endonuclease n=1 Tax=Phocoenobacter atlanticus TaxID=3416742 RepID=UPI0027550D99|nr:type III restriction-modification system endonuclease [Pasteurella atlantica]MDP8101856.1 type III restriction-modification system endonuclease [Pasteurella atlantica]